MYLRIYPAIGLFSILSLLVSGCGDSEPSGGSSSTGDSHAVELTLGTEVQLTSKELGAAGGELVVSKSGDPLDGLSLKVPAGAYPEGRKIEISYAPVERCRAGKHFKPASPLISVHDGGEYARQPVTLTIPASVPAGHFAMGFYYDRDSKRLEALPLVSYDSTSVTVATRHFSDVLLGSVDKVQLAAAVSSGVDSGFKPGTDDWQFTNYGSCIAPSGHCAGQSIAAMWYYCEKRRKGEEPLHGRFDNPEHAGEATPDFWQDDTWGYRLASLVQKAFRWNSPEAGRYRALAEQRAENAWYAFAHSMLVTGEPQFIAVHHETGGHALVAYRMKGDSLYLADPNYPGNSERKIRFVGGRFEPYRSGPDASNLGSTYGKIYYIATSAMIDWPEVAALWKQVEEGIDNFPAYRLQVTAAGREVDPDRTIQTEAGRLEIQLTPEDRGQLDSLTFEYYLGPKRRYTPDVGGGGGAITGLEPGLNKVGIFVTSEGEWVDFRWLDVRVEGAAAGTQPNPQPTLEDDARAIAAVFRRHAKAITEEDVEAYAATVDLTARLYKDCRTNLPNLFNVTNNTVDLWRIEIKELRPNTATVSVIEHLKIVSAAGTREDVGGKLHTLKKIDGKWKLHDYSYEEPLYRNRYDAPSVDYDRVVRDGEGGMVLMPEKGKTPTEPEPEEEGDDAAMKRVVLRQAEILTRENLDAYVADLAPDSPTLEKSREMLESMFEIYDCKVEVSDVEILQVEGDEAIVRCVQRTLKVTGPEFRDNEMIIEHLLHKVKGRWLIYASRTVDVKYLNE